MSTTTHTHTHCALMMLVGASVFVGLRLGAIAASLRSRRGFAKAKAADEADASASVEF